MLTATFRLAVKSKIGPIYCCYFHFNGRMSENKTRKSANRLGPSQSGLRRYSRKGPVIIGPTGVGESPLWRSECAPCSFRVRRPRRLPLAANAPDHTWRPMASTTVAAAPASTPATRSTSCWPTGLGYNVTLDASAASTLLTTGPRRSRHRRNSRSYRPRRPRHRSQRRSRAGRRVVDLELRPAGQLIAKVEFKRLPPFLLVYWMVSQ